MSSLDAINLLNTLLENYEKREENGYLQVYLDGQWQWLHRVIAKEKMSSDIYEGFEVHHIDGDKQNNHPDNLTVLSMEEHRALHESQSQSKSDTDQDVRNYISDRIKHLHTGRKLVAGNASGQKHEAERSDKLEAILSRMRHNFFESYYDDPDNYYNVCSRCGGTGYLPEYKHVEGGVFFGCGGSGRA